MYISGLHITQRECFKPTDFSISKVPLGMQYSTTSYTTTEGKTLPVKLQPVIAERHILISELLKSEKSMHMRIYEIW